MAKKVVGYIKLQVKAGQANPSPPVGPALGQRGLNIMEFCKAFNAATQKLEPGLPIPVVITAYSDRSFTFVTKTPPASILLKKAVGIQSGSKRPNTEKVGKVTRKQLEDIAKAKEPDLTAATLDAAVRTIAGSARSMGLVVEGYDMAKISKRYKAISTLVEPGKAYAIDEALKLLKTHSKVKFVESVDVAVRLGIDAKKSDQQVRGSTVLPAGTGKSVRVAVFCPPGAKADEALAAGADVVGMDDLAEKMQAGDLNYDVVIATPDAMRVVGKLGQVLGPRGLMPNPKVGTVSPDAAGAVRNAKAGQVRYRTDKAGIVHCTIGKVNFEIDALKGNLQALLSDLERQPAASKGQYLQKISVSSTMGIGIVVDQSSLALAK